jgi:hypothetical protein
MLFSCLLRLVSIISLWWSSFQNYHCIVYLVHAYHFAALLSKRDSLFFFFLITLSLVLVFFFCCKLLLLLVFFFFLLTSCFRTLQFKLMSDHGTRIIIYNLWEDDQGMLELDFDSDPHVCLQCLISFQIRFWNWSFGEYFYVVYNLTGYPTKRRQSRWEAYTNGKRVSQLQTLPYL